MPGTGPARPSLARALGYVAAATLVFFAAAIAVFGMISLFTDTEVVDDERLGTLAGPLAIGASGLVFAAVTLYVMDRASRVRAVGGPRATLVRAAGVGIAVLVTYPVVLLLAGLWQRLDDPGASVLHALLRPYPWALAGLAFLVVLALLPLSQAALRGHTPRRWYWENDESE